MSGKKTATSKKTRRLEGSHQKLAENFLARLDRTWQQHGHEILDRVMAERPKIYFQALVRLTVILHRRLPEPPGFDRRQYRADVLQRLQQRAENARSGEISAPRLSKRRAAGELNALSQSAQLALTAELRHKTPRNPEASQPGAI